MEDDTIIAEEERPLIISEEDRLVNMSEWSEVYYDGTVVEGDLE